MSTLSYRQKTILRMLETSSRPTSSLAYDLNAPEASVRRDIQTLRAAGHYIEYVNGFATLRQGATAGAGVSGGARV